MSTALHVHFLPKLLAPNELRGGSAVVIDVLRASTTIITALSAGANEVIACRGVDEARRIAATLPAGSVVLGGERNGVLIDGFDLDNSPSRYTPATVGERSVVFTTTNGTQALYACRQAERILLGGFLNLDAAARTAARMQRPIHLVCSGTRGEITAEDVLCAGAFVAALVDKNPRCSVENDAARIASAAFEQLDRSDASFREALRSSRGGRDLCRLGIEADIDAAARRNVFGIVPEFHPETRQIRPADAD